MTDHTVLIEKEVEAALINAGELNFSLDQKPLHNMTDIARVMEAATRHLNAEIRIAFDVNDKPVGGVALGGVLIIDDGFNANTIDYRWTRQLVEDECGNKIFLGAPSAKRRLVANVAHHIAAFLSRPT